MGANIKNILKIKWKKTGVPEVTETVSMQPSTEPATSPGTIVHLYDSWTPLIYWYVFNNNVLDADSFSCFPPFLNSFCVYTFPQIVAYL